MDRCSQCHYPVAEHANTCGWCGNTLKKDRFSLQSFWKSRRIAVKQIAAESDAVTTAQPTYIPNTISSFYFKGHQQAQGQEVAHSDMPIFQTATLAPFSVHSATKDTEQFPPTEALSSWLHTTTMTPFTLPPPPPAYRQSHINPLMQRIWILAALPVLTVVILHNALYWSDIILATSKAWYIAAIIAFVLVLASLPKTFEWRMWLSPIMTIAVFIVMGSLCVTASIPIAAYQAQQAEQAGNYHLAMAIYQQLDSPKDIARLRLADGIALTNSHQFANALVAITFAQQQGNEAVQQQAQSALGTLYWKWGQLAYVQHDLTHAQQYWQRAIAVSPDSTGATLAKTALAAPLVVTGRVVWLGAPVPGLHVSLVSQWSYTSSLQLLQTGGERLQAVTGSDGSFTFAGAQPGTTYALVWEGSFGDTTTLTAAGTPAHTITLQPLQNGDLGTISIQG